MRCSACSPPEFSRPLTVEMWADMDKTGDPVAAARAACRFVADLIEKSFGGELPAS